MLLTTHSGVLVSSDHVICIGLRRELPSPTEPDPEPDAPAEPTFRVLLGMEGGSFFVAAIGLTLPAARFVREDIAHSWETGKARWKASESLRRLAEGAYFAEEAGEADSATGLLESEANHG